ncbi:type III pantothenate kinase [Mucilaginibacter myungsuensis]|uniref:Type III pantothenate kinase n=1 Tax=Mucilaginibacter myungsuensis TaxID=649104 RepID=A0A929KTV5_9SPHI|nr:type III pantothenate kinase [Mucilaginibacter myungsuensis]MBE9661449.1 type III pantothenate kinase [Mucilaginibacter myungsuensis]MDN3597592.1 type III pantothenate kinase [Mucilaginibacter myungsuensis]
MANLVIDIGNTLIKVAVFNGYDYLLKVDQYQTIDPTEIDRLITGYSVTKAIISTVKKEKADWEVLLSEKLPVKYFSRDIAIGIKNHYGTPQTLGIDRLVAVTAAHNLYPGKDNLVIDGGSCITYDMVDADGNYHGGSISPGLKMRFKAMHNYTSALPLIEPDAGFDSLFGNNTETAIRSGAQNGLKYELTGFIESYREGRPDLNILLTGGDAVFFDNLLKNSIFAPQIKNEPYLVLKGLNVAIQA